MFSTTKIEDIITISTISKKTLTSMLIVIITIIYVLLRELLSKKIGLEFLNKISFSMVKIIDIVIKVCKSSIIILNAKI